MEIKASTIRQKVKIALVSIQQNTMIQVLLTIQDQVKKEVHLKEKNQGKWRYLKFQVKERHKYIMLRNNMKERKYKIKIDWLKLGKKYKHTAKYTVTMIKVKINKLTKMTKMK